MAECEMYQQLKLMSVKHKKSKLIVAALIGISFLGVLLSFAVWNSCGIEHVAIISEIQTYEKTLDPVFCENLVLRILEYNDKCDNYIEIFDCG